MRRTAILFTLALIVGLSSCKKEEEYVYENGTYRAEAADFHYGWKAFMVAEIENDELVSVDFDYNNADGDLKSATTDDEYPMNPHPRVWLPQYESALMNADILNFTEVDVVSGATGGGGECNALFNAILDAAEEGDTTTQVLPAEE